MNAPLKSHQFATARRSAFVGTPGYPPKYDVWCARAEARARLWDEGVIPDLHVAIDPLQEAAVEQGLVAELGQDRVQSLLSAAFGKYRTPDDHSPTRGFVDFVIAKVRRGGLGALHQPDVIASLRECDQFDRYKINKAIDALIATGLVAETEPLDG